MFFAVAGMLASVLSSANAADAQRRYANAVKDATKEDLPAAWKSQLNTIVAQSARSQADFSRSIDDQKKLVQVAMVGGGLFLLFMLLK